MAGEMTKLSLGDVVVRAEPEALFSKAVEADTKLQSIKERFNRIKKTVSNSSIYWVGSAGNAHRAAHTEFEREIEEALQQFDMRINALRAIAQNYQEVATVANQLTEDLPQDVIL